VTLTFRGNEALAEFLEYIATECRRGTVRRLSIETAPNGKITQVEVSFNTTRVLPFPRSMHGGSGLTDEDDTPPQGTKKPDPRGT
jgi:hypothetical protein